MMNANVFSGGEIGFAKVGSHTVWKSGGTATFKMPWKGAGSL